MNQTQVLLGRNAHALARALAGRVLMPRQHRDGEKGEADDHRQHLRLVEQEDRLVLILLSRRVRDERGGADGQDLRDGDDD